MQVSPYALEWKNPRTGLGSLCEVEGGVVYELGTLAAMEDAATRYNQNWCHSQEPHYRAVPLPFAGEVPEHFQPDPVPVARVSSDKLPIDSDYGSEIYIRVVSCPSFLGLRRAIREMNPRRVPIYSDHDCTGRVCWQGCKPLKIYRVEGEIVAVVEITVMRDV